MLLTRAEPFFVLILLEIVYNKENIQTKLAHVYLFCGLVF